MILLPGTGIRGRAVRRVHRVVRPPSGATPYIDIHTIRHRSEPILTCALMAEGSANECGLFWGMSKAAKVWADLDALGVPGVQGVWSPPEAAGWGMTVVSIKQLYAGHAAQTMALAAQCMGGAYFTKYIIVVDEDIDPSNLSEVVWAMATRSRPAQSIDILRETWSTYLDPSLNPPEIRPWGSKCLINACMDFKCIKEFSPRTKLSRPVYERVVKRWKDLASNGIRRRSMSSRSRRPMGRGEGGGGQVILPLAPWRNESSIRQPCLSAVLLWRSSA